MVVQYNLQALLIKSKKSERNDENRKNVGGIGIERATLQKPGKLSPALALLWKKKKKGRFEGDIERLYGI